MFIVAMQRQAVTPAAENNGQRETELIRPAEKMELYVMRKLSLYNTNLLSLSLSCVCAYKQRDNVLHPHHKREVLMECAAEEKRPFWQQSRDGVPGDVNTRCLFWGGSVCF